ncbi:uncharacterized protein BJ212DRAFT_1287515 [Suillus subaureus]|uniref:Uncharacterized protein n=1 Tax=Suillus subaureus TaxID=48587 RepID=A0A9P7DPY3_9AGAM|nr:uncharacterized protein BJ212DRAFT_1287515 [Suillus subaureus]KAG1800099.1 hypothetical protein BJ212DRAFT_1287515 [Suillus subaureus]
MHQLQADPNLEQCPDFTSVDFQASWAPLLGPVTNDAQVAAMLHTIWTATNNTLKAQWQQQVDAAALQAKEQGRLLTEEEELQLAM